MFPQGLFEIIVLHSVYSALYCFLFIIAPTRMLFEFKKYDEDFLVKEILGFDLKGTGDVFYVQFQKKNMNTMDVVHFLGNELGIERKNLGISGLKDKNAISIQRIAVYKSVIQKVGGTEVFVNKLNEIVKVLKTNWHDEVLSVGRHTANHFRITLRFKNSIDSEIKDKIERNLNKVKIEGFPNCFGQQRFGKGNRNFKRARDILSHKKSQLKDDFEIRFKLQAYSSMYFNHYALNRWNTGQKIVEGDIVSTAFHARKAKVGTYAQQEVSLFDYLKCKEQYSDKDFFDPNHFLGKEKFDPNIRTPTGLIIGYNMLVCKNGSKAFFKDWNLIKKSKILEYMEMIKKYSLWGIRRPLWIIPKGMSYTWKTRESDIQDLEIVFTLPTGSYATVLLGTVFGNVDTQSCEQNKLIIPNEV